MLRSHEIGAVARGLVFLIFAGLGLSFLATTAVLISEYSDVGWLDLATADSHLFLFFPTLGILALVAFYTPACALTDAYWRHIPFGKVRFAIGAILLAGLAWIIAGGLLASPKRSIWEIAPYALEGDRGEPSGCAPPLATCDRLPALLALRNLRNVSQSRLGVEAFVRSCEHDALLESTTGAVPKRFCFASTPLSSSPMLQPDAECCQAQARLSTFVSSEFRNVQHRSLTSVAHAWLLPLKVFFLLTLLAISVLLVARHKAIGRHYPNSMRRIEAGVIVGTAAVLFLPFMSQAFVQSSEVLFGVAGRGNFSLAVPALSLAFGAWTVLTILFFFRRRDKELEALGKLGSAVAGAIAVLKYSIITDCFQSILGSGASPYSVLGLALISYAAAGIMLRWPKVR